MEAATTNDDEDLDECKERRKFLSYAHVAAIAATTSALFGVLGYIAEASLASCEHWLFIGFIVAWLCMDFIVRHSLDLRSRKYPYIIAAYIMFVAWCAPLTLMLCWLHYGFRLRFVTLAACIVPISLCLTTLLQRCPIQRPMLLIPLTVAAAVVPCELFLPSDVIADRVIIYALSLPFAFVLQAYVHCNIEVCLRRSPAMSPIATAHQIMLEAPIFCRSMLEYFTTDARTHPTSGLLLPQVTVFR